MTGLKEAIKVHEILVEKYGGKSGIRDLGALESAINRPYATFHSEELYPTAIDKATALIESIVVNHPFIDGNKRTGYVLMRLLLMEQGFDISATEEDKYKFVISIASGGIKTEDIREWIKSHVVRQ